jgi:hypothetical protein
MKRAIQAAFAAAVLLLQGACGTARDIAGDFASDAPMLSEVSPTQAVSGQTVQFTANICREDGTVIPVSDGSSADLSSTQFFWNFGTGAEPNTSTEMFPTVQIRDGIRAPYECHLTLRDGCVGKDKEATYDFTLFVTPLTVGAVSPTGGIGNGEGTFSVLVSSGVVTSFAWNFGQAASPSGSNQANPTVTFNEAGGLFPASVIVSNPFEAVEVPFTLDIAPDPNAEP